MNEKLILACLLIGSGSLSSCWRVGRMVYRADPIQVPCLTQHGDKEVSAGAQFNASLRAVQGGWNAGAAYAITDCFSIQGQFSRESGNEYGPNDIRQFVNIGPYSSAVYDSAFLSNRTTTWNLAEAYMLPLQGHRIYLSSTLGAGSGYFLIRDNGRFHDTLYTAYLRASSFRCFLQEALCLRDKSSEVVVGVRWSINDYSKVRTNYSTEQQLDFQLDSLDGNSLYMVQPFLLVRVNFGNPRWQLEFQSSINMGSSNVAEGTYNYLWFNAGMGLTYHFYHQRS